MLAIGALVLALAACGSNLDPADVAGADGGRAVDCTVDVNGTIVDGTGTEAGAGTTDGATTGGTGTTGDTGGTGTTGDTGTTGGSGDTGGSGGGDTGGGGAPTTPAIEAPSAASCEGLKNQTGITDSTITIGNSSDISGPAPGLFATAQDATQAFVAYFNASVPEGI